MSNQPKSVTNTELAILGLLAEMPKHGYQIEQDIQSRGMRGWADIGFSSIYHILNKLEVGGCLESSQQDSTIRPARKVYGLSPQGWQVYAAAVLTRLKEPRPFTTDFPLALANLGALPITEVVIALRSHHTALFDQIAQLQQKQQADHQSAQLPWFVDTLFEYSETQMRASADFIGTLLQKLDTTV